MIQVEQHFDTHRWAGVPIEFPHTDFETQEQWAAATAAAFAEGMPDPEATRAAIERVALVLPMGYRPGLARKLWYLVDPFRFPLIANIYVIPDSIIGDQDLSTLAGAYTPHSIRPPVVDVLESAVFGTVTRVVSVSRAEDSAREAHKQALVMRLSIAGRAHGFTVVMDANTSELDYASLALDDFTALMEAVRFVEE